jgi:hypothetical protein
VPSFLLRPVVIKPRKPEAEAETETVTAEAQSE